MNKITEPRWFIIYLLFLVLFQPSLKSQTDQTNDTILNVDQWLVSDPLTLFLPAFHDQNNLKGKTFSIPDLLKNHPLNTGNPVHSSANEDTENEITNWRIAKSSKNGDLKFKVDKKSEITMISQAVYIKTGNWTKVKVVIESRQCFELYLNEDKKLSNYSFISNDKDPKKKEIELSLEPGKYLLLIRSLFKKGNEDNWTVNTKVYPAEEKSPLKIESDLSPEHFMDIDHLLLGKQLQSVSLSPGGEFLMVSYKETAPPKGHSEGWSEIIDIDKSQMVFTSRNSSKRNFKWTPLEDNISYLIKNGDKNKLIVLNLKTQKEKNLYCDKDKISNYRWADDGSFIIFSREEKPEADKSGVKKFEGMPDRWPWWQNRRQLFRLNVGDRSIQRLTSGHVGNSLQDIHPEGTNILFSQNIPDFSERPYSKQYLMEMNLSDLSLDTIWANNFSGAVTYSPDGKKLLVRGSPAMFGEMGVNVKKGQIPNDYDTQAYIYDLETKTADPITKNFNPSIGQSIWRNTDNLIYFIVQDSTFKRLFSYNPETGDFTDLKAKADVVKSISVARNAPLIAYAGNGISNPSRSFIIDTDSKQHSLVTDAEKAFFENVRFGKTENWAFALKGGNTIDGRIYYPPDFDPQKKYPMIVYYYGGTSPTDRSFRGRYPKNLFAAMGYVVYVLQPSGATGYGQEFSARHVNNWGITVADEIINGTKQFLKEHPFVDAERVGCIGASYGGFMTMLLTTRTDIFSAAISHAGISSISSYWGQGYWGYQYSSTASANSFPWNNKEMYIEQSPLFNADKVNTPLLLLTGGADTNVPPGESMQLYTALKLLGKPVELIEIKGENHHILEYKKRILWQKTIFAWFDKWLKGESGWWEDLYPEKDL